MPRVASLLLLAVPLLTCCVSAQETKFKTLGECQAKEQEWERWADRNISKCKAAMKNADTLAAENENLRSANAILERKKIEVNLATAAIGIGIGIVCAFWLARALKRLWPVSYKGKQLVFMVCGAVWITVVALIAVNDSELSRHPMNMLFTVLVYSLPALAFGGIGFWWFGRKEASST